MRNVIKPTLVLLGVLLLASCSSGDGTENAGADGLGWTRVSSQELSDMMAEQDVYLVNVHVPYEGQIIGTDAHISYTEIASRLDELPSDQTLVIYCRSGNMSTQAAKDMLDAGATGFSELEGGFTAWEAAGLPFEV
ncbi:MAG TPA: rhodanese-like domain-containing protein [Actinomycetota bacterium]|nr:rhodanese-like domain-containing protein [Actinomycetota bacterium]